MAERGRCYVYTHEHPHFVIRLATRPGIPRDSIVLTAVQRENNHLCGDEPYEWLTYDSVDGDGGEGGGSSGGGCDDGGDGDGGHSIPVVEGGEGGSGSRTPSLQALLEEKGDSDAVCSPPPAPVNDTSQTVASLETTVVHRIERALPLQVNLCITSSFYRIPVTRSLARTCVRPFGLQQCHTHHPPLGAARIWCSRCARASHPLRH